MAPQQDSLGDRRGSTSSRSIWPVIVGLLLLQASVAFAGQLAAGPAPMQLFSAGQIFLVFFLMLGPLKTSGTHL